MGLGQGQGSESLELGQVSVPLVLAPDSVVMRATTSMANNTSR